MKNYRKIYESYHGSIPIDELGRSYHIHHKDGDNTNNNPTNLQAVSLLEHYHIHLEQGDWWAALRLAQRLNMSSEDISNLAKKTNARLLSEGKNHFLNPENASKAGKKGIQHVKENGWSKESIEKRVNTRKNGCGYTNKMKEANTPEAITKRVEARKKRGGYQSALNASHKSRIHNSLFRMCNHFEQPFSYELLEIARRKKIVRISPKNVQKHFSELELSNLWSPQQGCHNLMQAAASQDK